MSITETYDRDGRVIPDDYYDASKHPRGQAKWGTEQRVGRTVIGDHQFVVSTVWLFGIDHNHCDDGPPLIFETMVFGDPYDTDLARYATEEAAMRGHLATVDALRQGLEPFSWQAPAS